MAFAWFTSLCVSSCVRGKVPMANSTASTGLYPYNLLLSPKAPFLKGNTFELGFQGDTSNQTAANEVEEGVEEINKKVEGRQHTSIPLPASSSCGSHRLPKQSEVWLGGTVCGVYPLKALLLEKCLPSILFLICT